MMLSPGFSAIPKFERTFLLTTVDKNIDFTVNHRTNDGLLGLGCGNFRDFNDVSQFDANEALRFVARYQIQ